MFFRLWMSLSHPLCNVFPSGDRNSVDIFPRVRELNASDLHSWDFHIQIFDNLELYIIGDED